MNKELYISSTPHETRLALAEDGEVAEVYFEREKEYSLAGAIYKGRVTRVLPGMQSAFVDIGLERDAFLYVSDFFEDGEEYDRVVSEAENAVLRLEKPAAASAAPVEGEARVEAGAAAAPRPAAPREGEEDRRGGRRGGRQRGRRGGRSGNNIPDAKFARPGDENHDSPAGEASSGDEVTPEPLAGERAAASEAREGLEAAADGAAVSRSAPPESAAFVLPGESLAKYRGAARREAPVAGAAREPRPTPPAAPARSVAPAPAPPAATPPSAAAAYPAFVLPGETLAKYRNQAPPAPLASATADLINSEPTASARAPEAAAQVEVAAAYESESEEVAGSQSNTGAEAEVDGASVASVEADADAPGAGLPDWADEFDFSAPPGDEELTVTEKDLALDDDANTAAEASDDAPASASVRQDPGQARMQNPNPNRDGRDGRGRGRGRRRRHRGGERDGEREGQRDAARGAECGPGPERGEARPERAAAPAPRREGKNESGPDSRLIGDLLHEGQEILIQIAKEPLGKKGARITSHLALPGRFLVYMPTVSHIGVSRKIASDEERARLKRLILENTQDLPGGFIVRTAGQGASDEEFKADIRLLANQWTDMRQQFEKLRAPALLHHDLNLVERTLRDQLSDEFSHIWVDTDEQYQRIVKFVSYFMPHLVGRVRLYTRDEPLFEHFGIQEEINKALKSKVWLKSGGYIVINQTEALVAIDVNTGKYVGKSNRLEDTIVKTNVDAIKEIVRQIRLRDLGGIIVIDFIDMDERRNRQRVMQALDEAMLADRAPNKVLAFNDFGLVALTRKRVKQSLERTLGTACPYCEGVGLVKSPTTVCNEIYAEVRKLGPGMEREDIVLRVNPEVAKVLKERGGQRLHEMEELVRKAVSVRPDPQKHQEQFEIY